MTEINIINLRKELIDLLKSYLGDKNNTELLEQAQGLYFKCKNLGPLVDHTMSIALNILIDLANETGIKQTDDYLKKIIIALEKEEKIDKVKQKYRKVPIIEYKQTEKRKPSKFRLRY